MQTPEKYYLTKVNYVEEKKQVITEFTNNQKKICRRYSFFPSMIVPTTIPLKTIEATLTHYDHQKYEIIIDETIKITTATFEDLKKIYNLITSALEIKTFFLEPERQFLIQKKWSYFDTFEYDGQTFKKNKETHLPSIVLDFLPFSLPKTLELLLEENVQTASNLIKQLVMSNILKIAHTKIPMAKSLQTEILIENECFKQNISPPGINDNFFIKTKTENKKTQDNKLKQINFEEVWTKLLTKEYYNLGFDTNNCECCKPKNLYEKNILPTSTIKVKFLLEDFYFNSNLDIWSEKYHETRSKKVNRLKIKKDWHSTKIPVGPFKRNQIEEIPLVDALDLIKKEKIELIGEPKIFWHCKLKDSINSKIIKKQTSNLECLIKEREIIEKEYFAEKKLLGLESIRKDLRIFLLNEKIKATEELINHIPIHLRSPKSRFYNREITENLLALQSLTRAKFKDFLAEKGVSSFISTSNKILVGADQVMKSLSEFSLAYNIPKPNIQK